MGDFRARVGRQGEDAVARWYEERGYSVLARNWRCAAGELDLVLLGPGAQVVVFCEVKTRRSSRFGHPAEAVGAAKQRRLHRLAGRWLREAKPPGLHAPGLRLDVAAVRSTAQGVVVEVIEDAC